MSETLSPLVFYIKNDRYNIIISENQILFVDIGDVLLSFTRFSYTNFLCYIKENLISYSDQDLINHLVKKVSEKTNYIFSYFLIEQLFIIYRKYKFSTLYKFLDTITLEIFVSSMQGQNKLAKLINKLATNIVEDSYNADIYSKQDIKCALIPLQNSYQIIYSPENVESMLIFDSVMINQNEVNLKICETCNKFFIASRNDTKNCSEPSPFDETKTCIEYSRYMNSLKRANEIQSVKLYKQIYNMLLSRYKRSKNTGNTRFTDESNKKMDEFMREANEYKEKLKRGICDEEYYVNWLSEYKKNLCTGDTQQP